MTTKTITRTAANGTEIGITIKNRYRHGIDLAIGKEVQHGLHMRPLSANELSTAPSQATHGLSNINSIALYLSPAVAAEVQQAIDSLPVLDPINVTEYSQHTGEPMRAENSRYTWFWGQESYLVEKATGRVIYGMAYMYSDRMGSEEIVDADTIALVRDFWGQLHEAIDPAYVQRMAEEHAAERAELDALPTKPARKYPAAPLVGKRTYAEHAAHYGMTEADYRTACVDYLQNEGHDAAGNEYDSVHDYLTSPPAYCINASIEPQD